MLFFRFLFPTGNPENEQLDRPISNFDVIGIPTDNWSSHFFGCFENVLPSCVLSFCCPCVMWAQIVVRAQIPLLISIKNAFSCCRGVTGYGAFIDFFNVSFLIVIGLIVTLILVPSIPTQVQYFLGFLIVVFGGMFIFAIGHTRTAFKEKYQLPSCLPHGCHFWDMLWDVVVSMMCLPCSLAQMARHVFQYNRMDTKLGLFFGDPSTLPPLRPRDIETGHGGDAGQYERPERADRAGLTWVYNGRHPNATDNTGAAHRQQEIYARQQQQMREEHLARGGTAPPPPAAVAAAKVVTSNPTAGRSHVIYNADGTVAK